MASTSLLANAAVKEYAETSSSSTRVSTAASRDIVTLSACFQFLSPNELIQAHSTCRQWQLAAANPLTFRAQIRVIHRDYIGIVSTGPKVSFSRPNRMKLASDSSLFQNFRILHLIGAPHQANKYSRAEEWKTMIQSTLLFKSFHTLRLSVSNLAHSELMSNVHSSGGGNSQEEEQLLHPNQLLLNQLFQSATCKYLQVLTLDITQSQLSVMVDDFFPYFPSNLNHLQLNLMKPDPIPIFPARFEEHVSALTQLRSMVIADDQLRLLVHSRMNGVIKHESYPQLLTLTEGDISTLSSLSSRMPALDIRCIVCIDLEELEKENSLLIRKQPGNGDAAASSSSSSFASSSSVSATQTFHIEEIYIKNVNILPSHHGNIFHLLTRLAPRAHSLSLINVMGAVPREEIQQHGSMLRSYAPQGIPWPATLVESLTSLQVIYGNLQVIQPRAAARAGKMPAVQVKGPEVLSESNHLLAAARFANLTHLTIGLLHEHEHGLDDSLADFFATIPSLTHLSLYSVQLDSFSFLFPLRNLRIISGLELLLAQEPSRSVWSAKPLQDSSTTTAVSTDGLDQLSKRGFQRALDHVTEMGLDVTDGGRLTAPLLTALLSLSSIEKVRINGGAPLSRKMLRIHLDKIETIRKGFRDAAAGHDKLEEERKAKLDSLGYGLNNRVHSEEIEDIDVDEEERRCLRSSLVSTLQQAKEQETQQREQLSHTEYEARVGGLTDLTLSAAAKFRASRTKKGPVVFDGSAHPPSSDGQAHSSTEQPHSSGHKISSRVARRLATQRFVESSESNSGVIVEREIQRIFSSLLEDVLDEPGVRMNSKSLTNQLLREIETRGEELHSKGDGNPLTTGEASSQRLTLNSSRNLEEDQLAEILCSFAIMK